MAVLISIQPQWCNLIASGQKTIEIRKNAPKQPPPFTCYIYMTATERRGRLWEYDTAYETPEGEIRDGSQKVIGEFICDAIQSITKENKKAISEASCVPLPDMYDYAGAKSIYGLMAWHISNLKIYDTPKPLNHFWQAGDREGDLCIACPHHETPTQEEPCKTCDGTRKYLCRPPQSWCYVEEQNKPAKNLSHIVVLETEKRLGAHHSEEVVLYNQNRITMEETIRLVRAGEYNDNILVIPKSQWISLFTDGKS